MANKLVLNGLRRKSGEESERDINKEINISTKIEQILNQKKYRQFYVTMIKGSLIFIKILSGIVRS